jgi:hypothetical protein
VLGNIVDGVPRQEIKPALSRMHVALCARGEFGSFAAVLNHRIPPSVCTK